jgi:hypothetical protein
MSVVHPSLLKKFKKKRISGRLVLELSTKEKLAVANEPDLPLTQGSPSLPAVPEP